MSNRGPAAVLAVAVLSLATAACCNSPGYHGDGKVERHFRGADIDLGPVDLSKAGSHQFKLAGLSACGMVVGFRMSERNAEATVRVTIRNERDELVVDEQGSLQEWVWMEPGYFVYKSGGSRDQPFRGTQNVNVERIGTHADDGWGTYFTPRSGTYRLVVEVLNPSIGPPPSARLTLECTNDYSL